MDFEENSFLTIEQEYLLSLISCALNGIEPKPLPVGAKWDSVRALAVQNSVESIAWAGAKPLAYSMPSELVDIWRGDADSTLYRLLQFDAERERVLTALQEKGLSYLPLKGILMVGYYPDPSMRSMCDNDILYGFVESDSAGGFRVCGESESDRQRTIRDATAVVSDLMRGLGYKDVHIGHGNADVFEKEPCFNFEMHRMLMEDSYEFAGFFANPWATAVPDAPGSLSFHYSASDEYLFHIAHAYKHAIFCGCGIRNAVDELVFLRARGEQLDWGRVNDSLAIMGAGVVDFESRLRRAAEEAFGIEAASNGLRTSLSLESASLLGWMMDSGTYGNLSKRIGNALGDSVVSEGSNADGVHFIKLRYLINRLVRDERTLADYWPVVAKYPVLKPLYIVGRLGKAVLKAPKVLNEVREVYRYGRDGK